MTSRMTLCLALGAALAVGCGDNGNEPPQMAAPDATTPDAPDDDPPPSAKRYKQVEHLARPGINEALLISEGFLAGYNATAPTFAGVPAETLGKVAGEAKTVLKAVYLGACLLNGALGLSAEAGVKPAGMTCHAVGPAIWEEGSLAGVTLTAASQTAAQAYADTVFGQFILDVMRIDTSADSGYLTLCGGTTGPLLCGGRRLNEDVIDITYNYLINGAATTKSSPFQVQALTSDGVQFAADDALNSGNTTLPDPSNAGQFHGNVSNQFPYSARPL